MASLFVIQGADQSKRFEFTSGPVAMGRDSSNAVRLHDTEVSRRHAELRLDREGYRIVDLGSANGTFVNGQPVDQTSLHSGDRVRDVLAEADIDAVVADADAELLGQLRAAGRGA